MPIKVDPFWDGRTGGGVRCSSVGDDASRYLDPSTQALEGSGGRSIGSQIGGRFGLRGIVIPRSTALGGSRGFDPHKPRLVNIDPDIKGQSCVVDLSQLTKEKVEEAFNKAAEDPIAQSDIRLLAAQTFHNLAIGYEPVGIGPSRDVQFDRRPPLGDLGTYVVPKAALGGGQLKEEVSPLFTPERGELLSPSVTPRNLTTTPKIEREKIASQSPPAEGADEELLVEATEEEVAVMPQPVSSPAKPVFRDQSPTPTVERKPALRRKVVIAGAPQSQNVVSVAAPGTKVTFETEGWGQFEAFYHEVIQNGCILVLVYDLRFTGGQKYFPPVTDKLIALRVDGSDKVYFVHSYGNRFKHAGYEYNMLVIEQDNAVEEGDAENA